MRRRIATTAAAVLAAAGTAAGALAGPGAAGGAAPGPRIAGCPAFPRSNAWNRDVSKAPVDPRSAQYIAAIGAGNLHPDFASRRYGIPITVAAASQARVPVRFTGYPDESDPGPYRIPPRTRVEGGSDRHVVVVQRGRCRLYELFAARRVGDGWTASNGAVFDLRSNRRRPAGWTSADAAGLPIMPGLARASEASAGAIRHALRFTVRATQKAYVAPARHFASADTNPALPPMGLRLRLKAGFDLRRYHGQARVILRALKTYGMIVADNGSSWFISGAPDPGWHDAQLEELKRVPETAFEVVRAGPLTRG
jgi:hypothetical protein